MFIRRLLSLVLFSAAIVVQDTEDAGDERHGVLRRVRATLEIVRRGGQALLHVARARGAADLPAVKILLVGVLF